MVVADDAQLQLKFILQQLVDKFSLMQKSEGIPWQLFIPSKVHCNYVSKFKWHRSMYIVIVTLRILSIYKGTLLFALLAVDIRSFSKSNSSISVWDMKISDSRKCILLLLGWILVWYKLVWKRKAKYTLYFYFFYWFQSPLWYTAH